MPFKFNTLLRALLAGGSAAAQPLRFATPQNHLPDINPVLSSATEKSVRSRLAFRIGSANMSSLVLSFNGWYTSGSVQNLPNAFSVVKIAIEKNGQSASYPVTFGGLRTITINPGDIDIKSDELLPSAFGLGTFTRGDLYYMRIEISVANGGTDSFPASSIGYAGREGGGITNNVGLRIDTGVFTGGVVDSFGTLGLGGTGWTNFTAPYTPFILGRSAGGAHKSVMFIGDSIVTGTDTATTGVKGFGRGLCDADGISNAVAGAVFGTSGANAGLWNGSTKLKAYLKYATHIIEAFGTNNWGTAPGADPTAALAACQVIWTDAQATGAHVSRVKLLPRTTGNATTPANAAWASGGNARLFNGLLDTAGVPIIPRNSLRVGATDGADAFYQWTGGATNTADYLHPKTAGAIVDAVDLRAGIAALP